MLQHKKCIYCKKEYKVKRKKQTICGKKECKLQHKKIYMKEYLQNSINKKNHDEGARRWKENNPDYCKNYNKKHMKDSTFKKKKYIINKKWKENNPHYDRKYMKERMEDPLYKKVHNKGVRRWQKNNPERHKKNCERWQKNNPERVKEITKKGNRKRYKNNPQKCVEDYKKWRKTSRGKTLKMLSETERINKIKGVIHAFTPEQYLAKIKATRGICPICFRRFINNRSDKYYYKRRLTTNHEPALDLVEKGYIYTINKVTPMCQSCNSKLHNKHFRTDFKGALKKIKVLINERR